MERSITDSCRTGPRPFSGFNMAFVGKDLPFLSEPKNQPDKSTFLTGSLPTAPATTPPPVPPSPTPHPACKSTEFYCSADSRCIAAEFICDFRYDCSDGEEELQCAQPSCDFESGTCGWLGVWVESTRKRRAPEVPKFKWDRQQGKTKLPTDFRPSSDHTLNNGNGYYLFADNSPGQYRDIAQVISPVLGRTAPDCYMEFYYHMGGTNVGSMQILTAVGNSTYVMWSISGRQGEEWHKALVYIGMITGADCLSSEFRCANNYCIDMTKKCNFVDDCMDNTDEEFCDLPGRCPFEHGTCDWFNEGGDNFDWAIAKGDTQTRGTGPSGDHTTRSDKGGYLYIEGNYPQYPWFTARIASTTISKTSQNCRISFWYHMYGTYIGTLAVYVRTSYDDPVSGLELMQNGNMTGDSGDFWWQYDEPITSGGKDFKIVIEGMVGRNYLGDIAIDDVTFSEGCIKGGQVPGEDDTQQPTHGTCDDDSRMLSCDSGDECFYTWERCNFNYECSDKSDEKGCGTSCNFESGQCGWDNVVGSQVQWVYSTGPAYTRYSGPGVDHTLSTTAGHFMLFKANTRYTYLGYTGFMKTLPYQHSGENCQMSFWYHQYGLTMGSMDVYLKYADHTSSKLWNMVGTQGNMWKKATIDIGKQDEFSIVFEGVRSTSIYGDIGIDDIQFLNCYDQYYDRPCDPGTEFQCVGDKSCLPLKYYCDYGPNCKDGSDEELCVVKPGDCHFDDFDSNVWCSWEQYDDDDFDWSLSKMTLAGPVHDHTTINTTGNSQFAYADSSTYPTGAIGRISTPSNSMFPASRDLCFIRFWYYMYFKSDGVGTLRLYTESNEANAQRLLIWHKHSSQGDRWNYANVVIGNTHPFKVVFEIIMGNTNASDIAIDDVTFTESCLHPDNDTLVGSCPRNHLYCPGDKVCIPSELVDDGEVDCPSDCYDETEYRNDCDSMKLVPTERPGASSSPSVGVIIGGAIGGLVFAVLIIVGIIFGVRCFRAKRGSSFSGFNFGGRSEDKVTMSGVTDPYDVSIEKGQDANAIDNPMYGMDTGSMFPSKYKTPENPTSSQNCGSRKFACKSDNKCMDNSLYCNFISDCADGSDESDCPATCDFSNDECGWYEDTPNDNFNWLRGRPSDTELTPNLAPRFDHTKNNAQGYYVYIDVNGTYTYPYQTAEYYSPVFSSAASKCRFSFWWYQDGRVPHTMEVWLWKNSTQDKMFDFYGRKGPQWNQVTIGIGRQVENWQIKLNKKRYSSYDAATAIDDIAFIDCAIPQPQGPCDSTQYRCTTTGGCIDKNMVCDSDDDCGDGFDERNAECDSYTICNFENGTCGWTQPSDTDQIDWTWASGDTPRQRTGPPHDHTYANSSGHYMYIEGIYNGYGRTAQLVRVFHHMYGEHIGKLTIYTRIYNNSDQGQTVLWQYNDQKGMYWDLADAVINIGSDFQIVIEGMLGDSYYGNLAIDDISLTPGCELSTLSVLPEAPPTTPPPILPSPTPHPSCARSEFFCTADSRCIPAKLVCNFINDCSDGEEEVKCAKTSCNFENGDCGWTGIYYSPSRRHFRAAMPPFVWDKKQGKTKRQSEYRPAIDHTTNSGDGHYLFADNSPGVYTDTAQIISPVIGETGPNCHLEFWYHMTGTNAGTLEVMLAYDNVTMTRLSISGSQIDEWVRGYVYIGLGQGYQVIFQAIRGRGYQGDECIDDITFLDCEIPVITGEPCSLTEFQCANQYCIDKSRLCNFVDDCMDMSDEDHCANLAGRCDFEVDMCGWKNEKGDHFDWTLYSGKTHKRGTGPLTDHTTRSGQGSYLVMMTSYNQAPGFRARVSSPTIKGSSTNCKFTMWYHIVGRDVGSLNILLRTSYLDNTNGLQLVKNITGSRGDYWSPLEYVVDNGGKDFKIVIEGEVGSGYYGDIAVDDVTFTEGCIVGGHLPGEDDPGAPEALPKCQKDPLQYQCASGDDCYQPWQRCNFINDCQDKSDENDCGNSCNFEYGQCGWQNTIGDTMKWRWTQGPSWSPRTGPNQDHTTGNTTGHFMLIKTDLTNVHPGYKTHLMSLGYQKSHENCELVFWYYMFGHTVGSLSVHLKYDNYQSKRLWIRNGAQGEAWQNATLSIGKWEQFWIIFEGTRGSSRYGDIAIDDVQFNNCGDVAGARTCDNATEFQCLDNKRCLSLDRYCDYRQDCGDGSDEQQCVMKSFDCHFDDKDIESCQWEQLDDGNVDWTIGQSTQSSGTGPDFDHTTGSGGKSNFAYVDSSERVDGDVARIATMKDSPFPATTDLCTVRFWYHMYSSEVAGMGTLRIYTESTVENKQRLLMWQIHGNQGNYWNYGKAVLSNPHQFKVVFEAVMGNTALSDIAIDDVTFTSSCLHPADNGTSGCLRGEFRCPADNTCIPYELVNNGKIDCLADCYDEDQYIDNCGAVSEGPGFDFYPGSTSAVIAGGIVGGVLAFAVVLLIVIIAIRYNRKTGGLSFAHFKFGSSADDKVRMSDVIDEPNESVNKEPYSLDNPVYGLENSKS
ncbi:MAM and LDL-receptor class A domain-containing protein 2-like [Glandiceps talaboti]